MSSPIELPTKSEGLATQGGRSHIKRPSAAENLDRLAADKDLNLRLALSNYQGPEWLAFAEVLAKYGVQIIPRWTPKSGHTWTAEIRP